MSAGPAGFVAVAKADELAEGQLKAVRVGEIPVVLAKVQGQVYALADICTHELAYMHEGDLEGEMLVCPAHFSGFNVK
ncbi:MAG TPA: Rieske 2Fe-2S domain-containing protein, partial [bacterium]|nr:Rieske 2Fe-2S domain-containing protein [bacterium]